MGVNSNVEIYSATVLDEENKAPISRIIAGIYWAIENDVNILSISFGTTKYSEALEIAIKDATDKGILVVAAAGNNNSEVVEYPAAFDNVMAVGGVDSQGNIAGYSPRCRSNQDARPREIVWLPLPA
jgi:minor extracellular protease Epr